jgi:hypothetical protein
MHRKMRLMACLIVGILTLGLVLAGCGAAIPYSGFSSSPYRFILDRDGMPLPSVLRSPTEGERYDLSVVVTKGNRSFIPINVSGAMPAHVILDVLSVFEEIQSELEVTTWHIEKAEPGHYGSPITYGIWADHRPARQQ